MSEPSPLSLVAEPIAKRCKSIVVSLVVLVAAGCGPSGVGPFGVLPGASEHKVVSALKERGYCSPEQPFRERERFRRCNVVGLEMFGSWVDISIEGERIVRIARGERHRTDEAATRRWNELVSEHPERVGTNAEILRKLGELPPGALSWSSWTTEWTIFAVILVRTKDPTSANVVVIARDRWSP